MLGAAPVALCCCVWACWADQMESKVSLSCVKSRLRLGSVTRLCASCFAFASLICYCSFLKASMSKRPFGIALLGFAASTGCEITGAGAC